MIRHLIAAGLTLLLGSSAALAATPMQITGGGVDSSQGMPSGGDANQLLQQFGVPPAGSLTTGGRGTDEQQPETAPARRQRAEEALTALDTFKTFVRTLLRDGKLDANDRRFLEAKAKELRIEKEEAEKTVEKMEQDQQKAFAYLLDQVKAVVDKGEVSAADRRFLEMRSRDLGLEERDAQDLLDRAIEHTRRLELYRSIVAAFLEDGVLDASEQKHLTKKREDVGISDEEHEKTLAAVKKDAKGPPKDILADIREKDALRSAVKQDLELYGRDIFRSKQDSFEAAEGMPPPDSYLVGPGDRFQISLWGRLEADYNVQVDKEGKLQLPRIGPVKVGGLTYAEARRRLVGKAEAITGVSASVMLARMRSVQVFVVGEAEKPGIVTLSPLSTVVQAVLAAGGPTPLGSLRNVILKRGGKTNGTLDFYAFLQRGENPDDRPLHAGDVIVIPKAERLVKLYGKVKRQGVYELKAPEGLRALLGFAGGLSSDAAGGRIQVERNDKNHAKVVLNVSLPELQGDFPLQDGDVVRVFPLETDLANKVALYGHVYQSGIYSYSEGMRVSDLLGSAENLKPEVDLSYAVILREEGKDRSKTTIPFRLDEALGDRNAAGNPPLRARDEVYLFPRDQFRPPLRAKATGEVRNPGVYRFEQGARVADLVRLAGGLNSDALLAKGELLRYLPDRRRETRYVDLGKALAGDPDQNLPLSTEDELVVHPAGDRLSREVVVIEGEVNGIAAQDKEAKKGEEPRGKTIQERFTEILKKEQAEKQKKKNEEKAKEDAQSEKRKARVSKPPFEVAEKVLTAEEEEEQKGKREKEKEKERLKEQEEERKRTTLEIGLTQGMTVRDAVFKAGGLTKDAYLPVAHLYRTDPDAREITIRTFDLGKAMEGDPAENLELHDLDHVVIHSAFEFVPVQRVLASGMVGKPGEHPYARNMRVRDLVIAAGGLKEEAYLGQAEIVRTLVSQGQTTESHTIAFSLEKAMAGDPAANLPLEPYDKLFVKKIPEWKQDRKMELLGEVTFPGVYYIARGEKLSSVLRRAGGYTSDAYLPGAFFTRESARQQQQQRLNELRDQLQQSIFRASSQEVQGALSAEDVAAQKQFLSSQEALLQKLEAVQATGRVVVKLLPTEELERSEWDIVLEDGDRIAIPKLPQTVTVVGQVYNPTSFLWEPDHRTVGHYLQKTGGPTPDADAKNMYVVRADGTVVSSQSLSAASWWSRGIQNLDMNPGDTILVPEKVTRVAWLREVRDVTQIIYQIAVAAGVAVTLLP